MAYNEFNSYDAREMAQCEPAAQEPFTNQLSNRLTESEKRIADLISVVGQLTDRLFGPSPTLAKPESLSDMKTLGGAVPVQRSAIDQLLVQTNTVNRRLMDLSEIVRRLQSL
jgi:uncharacterized coiled-coil protein SlyX